VSPPTADRRVAALVAGSPSRARCSTRSFASAINRSRFIVMPSTPRRKPRRLASAPLVEVFPKPMVSKACCMAGNRSPPPERSAARATISFVPPPGRNQADPCLHQPDVRFGGRLHPVRVQGQLACPAQRQPGRRDHHGHVAPAQHHHRPLEGSAPCGPARPSSRPALPAAPASGWHRPRSAGPVVADDEGPWNSSTASRTPACSMSTASPPIAFIFEWNSHGQHAVTRSTMLAPGCSTCTTRPLFLRERRIRRSGPGRRHVDPGPKSIAAGVENLAQQRRIVVRYGAASRTSPPSSTSRIPMASHQHEGAALPTRNPTASRGRCRRRVAMPSLHPGA
jgi:hypothetical protein